MISGVVTGILLASFLGIAAWAWSSRQRERFDDAARLPLVDDVSNGEWRAARDAKPCCRPSARHACPAPRRPERP